MSTVDSILFSIVFFYISMPILVSPGPSAYRADALPTELRCQLVEPEFNPYKHTHLQITPPLSFFRVDFLNDIFLIVDSIFSMDVHS